MACFSKPAVRDRDQRKPRAHVVVHGGGRRVVLMMVVLASSPQCCFAQYVFTAKASLKTAVDLWVSDPTAAAATYGDINTWDVSQITDMTQLVGPPTKPETLPCFPRRFYAG